MQEALLKIPPEKRDRILNSALEEFSNRDYEKASTNDIAQRAEVSKGLIFHYFGSKQALYEALLDFAVEYVLQVLREGIDWGERDLFRRIQQVMVLKFSVLQRYPSLFDFMKVSVRDIPLSRIKASFSPDINTLLEELYTRNIDLSLFRPDVDVRQALEIIQWTLQGVVETFWKEIPGTVDPADFMAHSEQYLTTLRHAFYR